MEERRVELPESAWERLRKRPVLLAALVVACVVVLAGVGLGAYVALRRSPTSAPVGSTRSPRPAPPAETSSSQPATRANEPTSSTKPRTKPRTTKPPPAPAVPTLVRAPLLAYHVGPQLFVAHGDGSAPTEVGTLDVAAMSLSPDGKTLAVVTNASNGEHRLVLLDVATRAQTVVGPAEPVPPAWEASSASLVYQLGAHSPRIHRVRRNGTGDVEVLQGGNPGVSPDGRVVIASEPTAGGTGGLLRVFRSGSASTIDTQSFASALTGGTSAIWFATADGGYAGGEVWSVGYGGGSMRRLAVLPDVGPSSPEAIVPSPTQRELLVQVLGDDGFSRLFVVDLTGRVTPITSRRDAYPVGWSADGRRVLFVEGNTLLGEPTLLVSARSDGTGKRVLIEGAQP